MAKGKIVSFTANKKFTKPVEVKFKSNGHTVSFTANKTFVKPVKVVFRTKK